MKSYLQEKVLTRTYSVVEKRDENGIFTAKPTMIKNTDVVYRTMKRPCGEDFVIEGMIGENKRNDLFVLCSPKHTINISETESVCVDKQIYRADMNAYMVHTDKIGEEHDIDKEKCEAKLAELLAEYNKYNIEKDEKLVSYCKVHGLDPAKTDFEELKKIVYPVSDALTSSLCATSALKNNPYSITGLNALPSFVNVIKSDTLSEEIMKT